MSLTFSILIVLGIWLLVLMMVFIHFRFAALECSVNYLMDRYDAEHPNNRWCGERRRNKE